MGDHIVHSEDAHRARLWTANGWSIACSIGWCHIHVCYRRKDIICCWICILSVVIFDICVMQPIMLDDHSYWNWIHSSGTCHILSSFDPHVRNNIITVFSSDALSSVCCCLVYLDCFEFISHKFSICGANCYDTSNIDLLFTILKWSWGMV